jgi:hypothetical protein
MCKDNFRHRRSSIVQARAEIADQMTEIEAMVGAGGELPVEQRERLRLLDGEWCQPGNELDDLADAQLARRVWSRHAIVTKLSIIADRAEVGVHDTSSMIGELIGQIEEWRKAEPVIFGFVAGRVNA